MNTADTLIIGAGHNGLVCATLLAKAGHRVTVLEGSTVPGGLASERQVHDGFKGSIATSLYAVPSDLIRELGLDSKGFRNAEKPLPLIGLAQEADPVIIAGVPGSATLTGVSQTDQSAFKEYQDQLKTFAKALEPFWRKTMPRIGDASAGSLLTFAQLGLKLRMLGKEDMLEFFRVATLPMRDLVEEFFESELLKATLCWDGLAGSKMAPRSPNQAVLTLLGRMAGQHDGAHCVPKSGMRGFVNSLSSAASEAGAQLRFGAKVERLIIEADENGQRCVGVKLESGEELRAERVVSSADPKSTFLSMLGASHLEIEFANRIRRLRTDGYVAKLFLALSDTPSFNGLADCRGRMVLADSMDAIEFAYDEAKYGEAAQEPVMEVMVPSVHDASLAPAGQHLLSANVMYVPGNRKGGWTEDAKAKYLSLLQDRLEKYAPGLSDITLHAELHTPADLERDYGLTGGHWHHAEPAIDQLLMMRPTYEAAQYRTPIDGLFLCGAGSHPGGDLTGNPGRNAAREILR
ncbi:MAG: NAD(P)/FAD-dependent oxidoreductase [Pseudomonadota bacterium]